MPLDENQIAWPDLQCEIEDKRYYTHACGLVALSSDCVIETEFREYLRPRDITLFVNRLKFLSLDPENLAALENVIPDIAELIIPDDPLDVIAVGCASAAMSIGLDRLHDIIKARRPGIKVTDPVTASFAAFEALGCRKIGMITPYPDEVNVMIDGFFAKYGYEVISKGSFKQSEGSNISRISPTSIRDGALELAKSDPHCLLVSCTALRSASVLLELNKLTGIPVISSNAALAWHAMTLAGVLEKGTGIHDVIASYP